MSASEYNGWIAYFMIKRDREKKAEIEAMNKMKSGKR